jgi:hypothetical protein
MLRLLPYEFTTSSSKPFAALHSPACCHASRWPPRSMPVLPPCLSPSVAHLLYDRLQLPLASPEPHDSWSPISSDLCLCLASRLPATMLQCSLPSATPSFVQRDSRESGEGVCERISMSYGGGQQANLHTYKNFTHCQY